ncbi:MAG: hypothetical protein B7Z69_06690, partial [Actinobacteria bacterium 21-73-9]
MREPAHLVLADGAVFAGEAAGFAPRDGLSTGEFVFNTALSGYQEVITDPSYAGQVIAFTYPHVGNYGVTPDDDESARPWCRGVVVRELNPVASNWRAREDLETWRRRSAEGARSIFTRIGEALPSRVKAGAIIGAAKGGAKEAVSAARDGMIESGHV